MKPWHVALLGGATVGAGVLGVLMFVKSKQFEREGDNLRRQLTQPLAMGQYRTQMAQLREELAAHADVVGNRAADEYLANTYGITQDRIARIERLAQRLHLT